jgi:hypothetical protein
VKPLGFSCAYVRAVDEDTGDSCGRRATRRKQGEPKCMGHWVVEYLLTMAGGTEHARRTWAIASWILLVIAATSAWWLNANTLPHAITSVLLCAGLLSCFLREHPAGGILCLVSAVLTTLAWARGSSFGYYILHPDAELPENSTRTQTLLVSSLDVLVVVVFICAITGFVVQYFFDNDSEAKGYRAIGFVVSVLLFLAVVVYAIATKGRSVALVPWLVVMFTALAVARGGRAVRKLAAILRV